VVIPENDGPRGGDRREVGVAATHRRRDLDGGKRIHRLNFGEGSGPLWTKQRAGELWSKKGERQQSEKGIKWSLKARGAKRHSAQSWNSRQGLERKLWEKAQKKKKDECAPEGGNLGKTDDGLGETTVSTIEV